MAPNNQIRGRLVVPDPVPAIGAKPQPFNANLPNYRHIDILNMVIFYNNDFGIVAADSVGDRVEKFGFFLTEL